VRTRVPHRARLEREDPEAARARWHASMRKRNFDWKRVEVLEGNVGYIDLHGFAPLGPSRDTAAAAMAFVSNCDALIFDMRNNGGGIPQTVQFVCSYFFDERTHLNNMYWREGDRTEEFWTLDELPGKRLPDIPLFVLTSSTTFSGAEEFTYNLRTRERATVIGEVTRGGANPGRLISIDDVFEVFVPIGRAINPVTGTNWEGTGVEPHISVSAEQALEVALSKARPAAEAFAVGRAQREDALRTRVTKSVRDAQAMIDSGRADKAESALNAALSAARLGGVLSEPRANVLGYEQLQAGHTDVAVLIFRNNAAAHPRSANVWDSLGEGYMKQGQRELAIENYKKSLQLDPANDNATRMLDRLKDG